MDSFQNNMNLEVQPTSFLTLILREFDGKEITAKSVANAADCSTECVYGWLRGTHAPSIDVLPELYAKLPERVVDAIEAHLQGHRPARSARADDANGDGRTDHNDAADRLIAVGRIDLETLAKLRAVCSDGKCGPDDAAQLLIEVEKIDGMLDSAKRILRGLAKYPRRAGA